LLCYKSPNNLNSAGNEAGELKNRRRSGRHC
jgi:hypothetical protein